MQAGVFVSKIRKVEDGLDRRAELLVAVGVYPSPCRLSRLTGTVPHG